MRRLHGYLRATCSAACLRAYRARLARTTVLRPEAAESLSPEQRAVLLLHDVFGYGYTEIAEITTRYMSEAGIDRATRNANAVALAEYLARDI